MNFTEFASMLYPIFAVAAVADYAPDRSSERKLKKSGDALTLTLKPTVDILAEVAGITAGSWYVTRPLTSGMS